MNRASIIDSIEPGTLIALSYDEGETFGTPRPVAEILHRGTSVRGRRYVGVSLASTDWLRDGKVCSWTDFSFNEDDLDRFVRVCGVWDWSMAKEESFRHIGTLRSEKRR